MRFRGPEALKDRWDEKAGLHAMLYATKDRRARGAKKKEVGYDLESFDPNSRAQPPSSGDCDQLLGPNSYRKVGTEVDNQVAAPTETSTPNLHRATIAHKECGWKDGDRGGLAEERKRLLQGKEKDKIVLDTNRPSHGRS
jgi:hypothetical protein